MGCWVGAEEEETGEEEEEDAPLSGDDLAEAPARRTAATYRVWRERRWRMARSEDSLITLGSEDVATKFHEIPNDKMNDNECKINVNLTRMSLACFSTQIA